MSNCSQILHQLKKQNPHKEVREERLTRKLVRVWCSCRVDPAVVEAHPSVVRACSRARLPRFRSKGKGRVRAGAHSPGVDHTVAA
jgi:hypothetical protein